MIIISHSKMIQKRNKVVLSTFGPLHLIKSAEFLSQTVDIRVIQGWIPSWWNSWLLGPISKMVGYDLKRTIKKRTPDCLEGQNIGLGLPDFLNNAARKFIRSTSTRNKCIVLATSLYGWLSKFYIKDAVIFHVRSGSGSGGAIEYAKKKGMKVVVDHSIAHPSFMSENLSAEFVRNGVSFNLGLQNPFWRGVVSDCEKADVILVNSDFVKQTFIDTGFNPNKIKVVYLGVRNDFFGLKHNYIIDGKLKILFTGGFGFRKGAEYALKAMQKLDQLGLNYEFLVVGSNQEAQPLIANYPIKGLKLIGFIPQDDLKKYLSQSDIYLFPSLCEGCASSGMEALAAGLPVIATKESGLPITDRINGLIIESKNVNQIVDCILTLVDNIYLREKLGKNAIYLIRNNFSWDDYAHCVNKIYENILNAD